MVARFVRSRLHLPAAAALLLALMAGVLGAPLQTPPVLARQQDPPFPSEQELRELQQLVFACGRDNTSAPCEQARRRADPLLDHPRLPGSCKDVLWTIRQRSVVAASNSFERRGPIDRAARRLTAVCRLQLPVAKPAENAAPRQGGINLINPSQN